MFNSFFLITNQYLIGLRIKLKNTNVSILIQKIVIK